MAFIRTPDTFHLDFEHVYEPAEDSFLFVDALELELKDITSSRPSLCIEVGTGSGIISAAFASALSKSCFVIGCDLNPLACVAASRTASVNGVADKVDIICDDILTSTFSRLEGHVDVLLCNPPYVQTTQSEADDAKRNPGICSSWAGGKNGRNLIDQLISAMPRLLSVNGVAYFVLEQCNKPHQLLEYVAAMGWKTNIVIKRRAGRELLYVVKLKRF